VKLWDVVAMHQMKTRTRLTWMTILVPTKKPVKNEYEWYWVSQPRGTPTNGEHDEVFMPF